MPQPKSKLDRPVLVVGAGPIGIQTAIVLHRAGIPVTLLDQGPLGATMAWWPRYTQFFSSAEWIAIAGIPFHTPHQGPVTAEEYLSYLRTVVEVSGIHFVPYRKVTSITGEKGDFAVETETVSGSAITYRASEVVLATGEMAIPNIPDVPGAHLPHVRHGYDDPHSFFGSNVLVVGGRNSALEAVVRFWRAGATVAMSYRRPAIAENRTISRLFLDFEMIRTNGGLQFYGGTEVGRITPEHVELVRSGSADKSLLFRVPTDFVVFATGYRANHELYTKLGIPLEGEELQPVVNGETMESPIKGVYVVGTGTAGNQKRFRTFIATCHDHALRVVAAMTQSAIPELRGSVGNFGPRYIGVTSEDVE